MEKPPKVIVPRYLIWTICSEMNTMRQQREKKKLNTKQTIKPIPASVLKENFSNNKIDNQIERILDILNAEDEEDASVNKRNLEIYSNYLKSEIEMPCILTGIEDTGCFSWEGYYTFGPGNKYKYEKLKKKRASFTDEYYLIRIDEEYDNLLKNNISNVNKHQSYKMFSSLLNKMLWPIHAIKNFRQMLGMITYADGADRIYAKVQRISDEKKFILLLEDLEAVDKSSKNYQLFNDYAVWFVNYLY